MQEIRIRLKKVLKLIEKEIEKETDSTEIIRLNIAKRIIHTIFLMIRDDGCIYVFPIRKEGKIEQLKRKIKSFFV